MGFGAFAIIGMASVLLTPGAVQGTSGATGFAGHLENPDFS